MTTSNNNLTVDDLSPELPTDDEVILRNFSEDSLLLDYYMEAEHDWIEARVKVTESDGEFLVKDVYVHFRRMKTEQETVRVDSLIQVVYELSKRLNVPAEDFVTQAAEDAVESGIWSGFNKLPFDTEQGKTGLCESCQKRLSDLTTRDEEDNQ